MTRTKPKGRDYTREIIEGYSGRLGAMEAHAGKLRREIDALQKRREDLRKETIAHEELAATRELLIGIAFALEDVLGSLARHAAVFSLDANLPPEVRKAMRDKAIKGGA